MKPTEFLPLKVVTRIPSLSFRLQIVLTYFLPFAQAYNFIFFVFLSPHFSKISQLFNLQKSSFCLRNFIFFPSNDRRLSFGSAHLYILPLPMHIYLEGLHQPLLVHGHSFTSFLTPKPSPAFLHSWYFPWIIIQLQDTPLYQWEPSFFLW